MRRNDLTNSELRIVESYTGQCMIVGPARSALCPSILEALPVFGGPWPESCWSLRKQAETKLNRLQQLESLSLLDDDHLIEDEFNARYKAYAKSRLAGRSRRPRFK